MRSRHRDHTDSFLSLSLYALYSRLRNSVKTEFFPLLMFSGGPARPVPGWIATREIFTGR